MAEVHPDVGAAAATTHEMMLQRSGLEGHRTTHAAASTSAPAAAAAAALSSGPCRRSLHRRAQHAQHRLAPFAATPPHHSTSTTTTITGTSTPTSSSSYSSESADPFALTKSIMERVDRLVPGTQAGGAGGRTTYAAFKAADEQWSRLRTQQDTGPAPVFVKEQASPLGVAPDVDVVVCGGTLGIVVAAALQAKGFRVAVVERGPLKGRDQEWNISRAELAVLVELGLLTQQEVDACINVVFNPVRIGFHGGEDVWTRDVLNVGLSPAKLIDLVRSKFEATGGRVYERVRLEGVTVHSDGACLQLATDSPTGNNASGNNIATNNASGSGSSGNASSSGTSGVPQRLVSRLVLDCMGHASPIVKQLRWGSKPDGVCVVVGTLGTGFTNNTTGDVIATMDDTSTEKSLQYFWEAFPAGSGPTDRTTYMFTYLDSAPHRPSLHQVMEDYWKLMPKYQGVRLEDIEFKRVLFGFFPTFRDSPLKPGFDRVMQIGDASGIQSPLSFGGFGALTRHLRRLTDAVSEALEADSLDKESLSLIHAYNPGLSSAWMLQRAMSIRKGDAPAPNLINRMLSGNFGAMGQLGDTVMKPFLQDVIQFQPLLQTMQSQMMRDPLSIPQLLMHVGPGPLADWMRHVVGLGTFTALSGAVTALDLREAARKAPPRLRYQLNRLIEAWEYGSGQDYKLH